MNLNEGQILFEVDSELGRVMNNGRKSAKFEFGFWCVWSSNNVFHHVSWFRCHVSDKENAIAKGKIEHFTLTAPWTSRKCQNGSDSEAVCCVLNSSAFLIHFSVYICAGVCCVNVIIIMHINFISFYLSSFAGHVVCTQKAFTTAVATVVWAAGLCTPFKWDIHQTAANVPFIWLYTT